MGGVKLSGEGLDHVNIKSRHDALIADLKWKLVDQTNHTDERYFHKYGVILSYNQCHPRNEL